MRPGAWGRFTTRAARRLLEEDGLFGFVGRLGTWAREADTRPPRLGTLSPSEDDETPLDPVLGMMSISSSDVSSTVAAQGDFPDLEVDEEAPGRAESFSFPFPEAPFTFWLCSNALLLSSLRIPPSPS